MAHEFVKANTLLKALKSEINNVIAEIEQNPDYDGYMRPGARLDTIKRALYSELRQQGVESQYYSVEDRYVKAVNMAPEDDDDGRKRIAAWRAMLTALNSLHLS